MKIWFVFNKNYEGLHYFGNAMRVPAVAKLAKVY